MKNRPASVRLKLNATMPGVANKGGGGLGIETDSVIAATFLIRGATLCGAASAVVKLPADLPPRYLTTISKPDYRRT